MCVSKKSGQLDARRTSKPKRCETLAWLLCQFEKGVETFLLTSPLNFLPPLSPQKHQPRTPQNYHLRRVFYQSDVDLRHHAGPASGVRGRGDGPRRQVRTLTGSGESGRLWRVASFCRRLYCEQKHPFKRPTTRGYLNSIISSKWQRNIWRSVLVIFTFMVASSVHQFGLITAFVGAITDTLQGFVLPPLIYAATFAVWMPKAEKALMITMSTLGIVLMLTATYQNMRELENLVLR